MLDFGKAKVSEIDQYQKNVGFFFLKNLFKKKLPLVWELLKVILARISFVLFSF
jgi:hypothetical protein